MRSSLFSKGQCPLRLWGHLPLKKRRVRTSAFWRHLVCSYRMRLNMQLILAKPGALLLQDRWRRHYPGPLDLHAGAEVFL